MNTGVWVLAGPAATGKTTQVLQKYVAILGSGEAGGALWLAPNRRAVEEVRQRLLRGRIGYLAPGVMTFAEFAEAVVGFSGRRGRFLDSGMKRYLIRELIHQRQKGGEFRYFAQIAETAGFIELVVDWIREMKRLEIWPEQFRQACQARGMTEKDRELLSIYEGYQALLTEHELYDAEGRFWSARSLLAEGALLPPARRERLRLVVADGFTDFTQTQHEILEYLAPRCNQMIITLPLEQQPGREELFDKPRKTLQELQRRHKGLKLQWLPRPEQSPWPALAHIERWIFANPRDYRPLPQKAERIEILAAPNTLGEVELLAKRIKRLLLEGAPEAPGRPVPAEQIVVVFRSLEPVEGLIREVFARYGIPFVVESSLPLRSARGLVALMELLRLDLEDWPFRRILTVLNHSYFRPLWPEWQEGRAGLIADRLIRRLQIPQGQKNLLRALERLGRKGGGGPARPEIAEAFPVSQASEANSDQDISQELQEAQDARVALPLLKRLAEVLDALPQRSSLTGWGQAWCRLAEEVGIFRAIRQGLESHGGFPPHPVDSEKSSRRDGTQGDSPQGPFSAEEIEQLQRVSERFAVRPPSEVLDALAWEQLQEGLLSAERVWTWVGRSAPELDRTEAFTVLGDLLAATPLALPREEAGRVRVLSARSARPLRVSYLFVAGLSEKAFPPPEPTNRFYNEQQTQQLISQGLPLPARREQSCEEMLLFYEVITRADQRLVLSYPGLDESAQPLTPSPYLEELEAVCGEGKIEKKEMFDLRPIPEPEDLFSPRDVRVRALAEAMQGDVSLLAGLVRAEGSISPTEPEGLPLPGSSVSLGAESLFPDRPEGFGGMICVAEERHTLGENLLAAVRLTADRSNVEGFSAGEGMLQSPAMQAELRSRFPPDYVYAATALERYASCPFRFLLEELLGLSPLEDLELAEDFLERGRLVHGVLAKLHRRINHLKNGPASPTELETPQWDELLQEVVEETFGEKPQESVKAALAEVQRRVILSWLAHYREQYEKYEAQWGLFEEPPKPTYFEIAFGRANDQYPPLELSSSGSSANEPEKIRVSGRIDRIDVGRACGRVLFNILDYKSGNAQWKDDTIQKVANGTTLQLPLYLLAGEQLILADQRALPCWAGYWKLKWKPNAKSSSPVSGFHAHTIQGSPALTAEWEEIRQTAVQTVFRLVRCLRSGRFAVDSPDPECTAFCPWKTVCRSQQVRALGKTLGPDKDGANDITRLPGAYTAPQ